MLFSSPLAAAPAPAAASTAPAWIKDRLAYFADPRFSFDPEPHEYRLGERVLTSCTSWVKQYKEPFDGPAIAASLSLRRGCPAAEVLAKWERAGWVGTMTHEFIEHYYNHDTQLTGEEDPEVRLRCQKFLALHFARLHKFEPVAQELRVFHEGLGVCGTLDYLGWHKEKQELWVLDHKTSKKIGTDQDSTWRRMFGPFADLWDHELNVYSLQISLYRLMLEARFIPTAGGAIVWLPGGDAPAQIIPAIDYRERLRTLLLLK